MFISFFAAVLYGTKGLLPSRILPYPRRYSSSYISSTVTSPTMSSLQSMEEKEKVEKEKIHSQHLKVKNICIVPGKNLVKHEVKAELDGHRICVYEKAPESSKVESTILLIHGRTWSSLPVFDLNYESEDEDGKIKTVNLSTMDQLVTKNIRVFAIDLRGFGGTGRDESGWLTPYKAVDDIRSVINWLRRANNISTPCLLGWSQGGLVAHLFAQRYPNLISSCILLLVVY